VRLAASSSPRAGETGALAQDLRLEHACAGRADAGNIKPIASAPPREPRHDAVAVITSLPRLIAELLIALPYTARELPHLVQDLRELVRQLTRLAEGAPTGALGELVGELARAAGRGGELTALLRATAELARSRAELDRHTGPASSF
jgi:hypothetical protein